MLNARNIVLCSLLAFMAGCAFKTPPEDYKTANPAMADPSKTFKSSLESTALQPMVLGNWKGSLPCSDCEGITYYLTLQKDKTFQESSEYLGKNTTPVVERGTWIVNEDSVVQLTKTTGQNYLQISKNTLVLLDQNGQRNATAQADRYVLRRITNGKNGVATLEQKRQAGIDFTASGSSWVLDIDTENYIKFRTGNNKIQLTSAAPTVQKLPGGKGSIYRAITDAGTLSVRITNQPCTDKASGKSLPYSVEVTANAQEYTGCGQYLTQNPLGGQWTLLQMHGQALKITDFPKGTPQLEINPEGNKISGNGGCNRIFGDVKLDGNQVSFGSVGGTKMACPGPSMTFENNYLKLLSGKTYTFELTAGQLTLKEQGKPILVYKKAS